MCTLVILRRPEHRWPIIIGANRDEMIGRPALAPARHWPDRPDVVAAEFDKGGDKHVVEKLVADLAAKGHAVTAAQVQFELTHFAERAKQQLMSE